MNNLLDVRREPDFLRAHHPNAANIPLEELDARIHELPRPYEPLTVFDTSQTRAEQAADDLKSRGRDDTNVIHGEEWLHTGPVVSGPATVRLWRTHDLLVEAVKLMPPAATSASKPRALDLACGAGRDAVFLAMQGFDVDAFDILPDALDRCRDLAKRNGVTVNTDVRDVEQTPNLGKGVYDLICVFNFLHRPLMPAIAEAVPPGGLIVYETFLAGQRERFGKPRSDDKILKLSELPTYFDKWEQLTYREGLTNPRRFAASLIARKPIE